MPTWWNHGFKIGKLTCNHCKLGWTTNWRHTCCNKDPIYFCGYYILNYIDSYKKFLHDPFFHEFPRFEGGRRSGDEQGLHRPMTFLFFPSMAPAIASIWDFFYSFFLWKVASILRIFLFLVSSTMDGCLYFRDFFILYPSCYGRCGCMPWTFLFRIYGRCAITLHATAWGDAAHRVCTGTIISFLNRLHAWQ
jgi:hypothetical protein